MALLCKMIETCLPVLLSIWPGLSGNNHWDGVLSRPEWCSFVILSGVYVI